MKNGFVAVDVLDAYVLVLEHDLEYLVQIVQQLTRIGVRRYEWKASGLQVLAFAKTMPRVDLILIELYLPIEDGFAVVKKIKKAPEFRNTRLVAMCHPLPGEVKKAQAAGFHGFITKPIDPDTFPNQIHRILRGEEVWPKR